MRARVLWKPALAVLLFSTCHSDSFALSETGIELLTGNQTQLLRLSSQFPSSLLAATQAAQDVSLAWEWSLGYWRLNHPDHEQTGTRSLIDIGLMPTLRWRAAIPLRWYGEAGVGPHWLSRLYDNNGRLFSTRLQFASVLGAGYQVRNDVMIGIRVEHMSNGGIRHPNPGVNFIGIRIGKAF